MTNERALDRAIEERVTATIEQGADTYSPYWNRVYHQDNNDVVRGDAAEVRRRLNKEIDCRCYPRGVASMPAEDRAALKQMHIEAGVHRIFCPAWVDPSPMFSRRGDTMPPSYTTRQQRQDDEAESPER